MLLAVIVSAWLGAGQAVPPSPAVDEVRQTLTEARKAVGAYKAAGGAAGVADHPAIKWDAVLWAYREKYPRTPASALATAEAVRLLDLGELWTRARDRVDSVALDDPAWERLPTIIYEEGIARQELAQTIERLSRVAQSTAVASNKAATLIVIGRAHRRLGQKDEAVRSFAAAKAAAPDTHYAEDADDLIYEITHLSVGLPAPPVAGKARHGRGIDIAKLRGKAVVLVFWGTT
jgi:hypothetical protein